MARPVDPRLVRASGAARRHLMLTAVLSALAALSILAQALFLGRIVAAVFLDGAGLDDVRGDMAGLAVAIAARAVLMAGFETAGHRGAARAMSDLRARLARHLLRDRPVGTGERGGELATDAVQGVDALEAYFARYLPQLMLALAVPVVALAWIIPADRTSAIIIGITMPVVVLFMVLIGLGARARAEARWRALGDLGGHFMEVVRGLAALRAHNRAGDQAQAVAEVGERFRRETMGTLRIAFLSALVLELAASLAVAMVAVVIGVRLAEGTMAFATGFTVLLLAPEIFAPLRAVGAQFHASADGMAAAERIFTALDAGPGASAPGRGVALARAPERIRLEGLRYEYPARPGEVLSGFDLELARGERVALVGPSGSGKSTVVALLLGLVVPQGGRILVDGVDLADVDPASWRERVAWVPQRAHVFRGTVADNVRLGNPRAGDDGVRRALEAAGAAEFVRGLPRGADTVVGDGGRRLSAGESQRIALARAFVRDADIVVLDEPTAHVDPGTAAAIARAVERLTRGRMALIVSHRDDMLAHADRVVRMTPPPVPVAPDAVVTT